MLHRVEEFRGNKFKSATKLQREDITLTRALKIGPMDKA
jgi:hypothetical protein